MIDATKPVATASAGSSFLDFGGSLLTNALNIYGQVETAKAARSSSGGDQIARLTQPDIPSGQTVNVEAQKATSQANNKILGVEPKNLLILSGLVLAFGVALKRGGFK